PLTPTKWGETDSLKIWPAENNIDFDLQELVKLKNRRNKAGLPSTIPYTETMTDGRIFSVMGNPNLGEVRGMLMAIEDVAVETVYAEVWFNELRLSKLDEKGGYAAVGRLEITGADLFNLSLSGSLKSTGFGTLEQRVNERS